MEISKSEIDLACIRFQEFTHQHLVESLPQRQASSVWMKIQKYSIALHTGKL
jgi:hypothetical protein